MVAGAGRGPRRAAGAGRRVRRPRRAAACGRGRQHRLRVLPLDDLDRRRHRDRARRSTAGTVELGPNDVSTTPTTRDRRGPVLRPAAGLVRRRPRTAGQRDRAAPAARPRPRRRRRTSASGGAFRPRRHPRAGARWCGTATPRSTAPPRRCSTAYGAYEAVYPDQEWDPAIPSPARPRGGLRPRPRPRRRRGRPALVARRPAGAQAAHVHRPRRRRRRPGDAGLVDGDADRHAAGCQRRRAAAGRGVQPAARTAGGPWSPRCRSSTWSPRCSTPRSR